MPRQFADALLRLAREAFPSLSAADLDQVVHFNFKRGLGSQEVTYSLRSQVHGDLNDAITCLVDVAGRNPPTGRTISHRNL
ncbi:unnamed protein product [Schistocephalus solidus]|uniref:Uncharacterized protein n=1 Tax=Schistocephalus solidus TaxID=70667 RepID=A0A183TP82_SCHSO|nr:unnamed protein product [Schistocephalus solidus]